MARTLELPAGAERRAHVVVSERADGDLAPGAPDVEERRRLLLDAPWTWLRQVHGTEVVRVRSPGDGAGTAADAAVTDVPGAVLSVQTADCAPVVLVAPGAIGVAHAGWRGLADGVLAATVEALAALAPGPVQAWLGPCIHPGCYEFGPADLEALVDVLGEDVVGATTDGRPALDLPAAVAAALAALDVAVVGADGRCTACEGETCWSHRARADVGRHAVAAVLEVVA